MATKDISDRQVVEAYIEAKRRHDDLKAACLPACAAPWPYDVLNEWTGQPFKVCYAAMRRADRRDLIEYGVSLRAGWVTAKGEALLREPT